MPKPASPRKTKSSKVSAPQKRRSTPAPRAARGAAPPTSRVSQETLAARAYAFFLARGGRHGNDWADWFQAEEELCRENGAGQTLPAPARH